jgi:hypothetical protein
MDHMLFNNAVSTENVIWHQNTWQNDHNQWTGEEVLRCISAFAWRNLGNPQKNLCQNSDMAEIWIKNFWNTRHEHCCLSQHSHIIMLGRWKEKHVVSFNLVSASIFYDGTCTQVKQTPVHLILQNLQYK